MFEKLQIFRMSHAMAQHAGARQAVLARNMANADTPGYEARDIAPFAETYDGGRGFAARATRPGHFTDRAGGYAVEIRDAASGQSDPNGNSVSLEQEMLKAVDVKRQHDRSLAIYKSSLTVLRAAIGRR
ncbi:flagellar biosynthesis protein FlgB [Pelagivirga sediminicola]|uniref:Flagellar biosynthesis protein FlgB n=1 Tax=Pelagivirga sediminicola TaxID=2170575 RepID=A0A2T7G5K6_9RHOB|nr:FlgB family protein [Pelagivirga sediminicola]PVA09701.1 flagellar biosynthesis protein FlgB [Pelagivirga sediminicola]